MSSPAAPRYNVNLARTGLALIAVQRGDLESAGDQYSILKSYRGALLPWSVLSADRILGLLAHTTGNSDSSKSRFEDALSFCRNAGYRPELAWTCCDYADTLLQRNEPGDRQKAITLLDESLDIARELSVRPLLERIRVLKQKTASPPAVAPTYPDGLTGREVEVLRLIVAGKTDREIAEELFISARTVGGHISNILNKTKTSNRAEAAVYAARQGLA